MWTRAELKFNAKNMLRRCFWMAVVVCLITAVFSSEFEFNYNIGNQNNSWYGESWWDSSEYLDVFDISDNFAVRSIYNNVLGIIKSIGNLGMATLFLGLGLWLSLMSILFYIFIGAPLLVGSKRFFMCNRESQGRFEMLLYAFRSGHFMNVVGIMLVVGIKTFLWTLLFIIPGIVKSYEYSMIPYILAENPGIPMDRAFALTREMTYGQKSEIFILDLSFILWRMLGAVTCGLANIFYVNPYFAATHAELYTALRGNAMHRGVANSFELPGFYGS
ncbi:MAG: DUF975 family protein [Lachnospiraceae bacterium]